MSRGIKVKLDTLYRVSAASEATPAHYTPVTAEIVSATSAVTIRATTNPDFDGVYSDLPVQASDAAAGDVYESKYARSLQFISFSCSDTSAEIYVSGLKMEEVPVESDENEGD